MNKIELLAPVGDFECLKAAVQNGADAVYLGASSFSARAKATNFDLDELKEAINYAKLRNVSVHLALNTLIKNDEFENAVSLALTAYNLGVDAIIIQDLGLINYLTENYPEIPLHASTQMTIHNLDGVIQAKKLGLSRVVLSRELSINEIKYIKENTLDTELEVFIHGALCISYSGQCLLSSMIGERSGNRGLCAGPCRLPFELIEKNSENGSEKSLDKGHILSPRDNCGIEYLPELIKMGISSLKIEGRMKTPFYVGVVTRIYRKYIDLVENNYDLDIPSLKNLINENLKIVNKETFMTDLEELNQVFNRGEFSTGHFNNNPNKKLIFKDKPNNMGIYIGTISHINENKGHLKLLLDNQLNIGDKISINNNIYTVSELMIDNKNFPTISKGNVVKIGRMKGNIHVGSKVYKLEDSVLNKNIMPTFKEDKNFKKVPLNLEIVIKQNEPIKLAVSSESKYYKNLSYTVYSETIPAIAENKPITKDQILKQLSKTGNTEFEVNNCSIILDDNLFVQMSILNELRRSALLGLENQILSSSYNNLEFDKNTLSLINTETLDNFSNTQSKISVLLNILNPSFDYFALENIDNLYIPLKFFLDSSYKELLKQLSKKFNLYVYMPPVIKDSKLKTINFDNLISIFDIRGFVISNISQIQFFKKYNLSLIGNYTLNIYNNYSIDKLSNIDFLNITISPELNKDEIYNILNTTNYNLELMVYGNLPVMTNNYCYLGKSNKCYPECSKKCLQNNKYYLKDRMNFEFRVIPDNTNNLTTIYNSKITSIKCDNPIVPKSLRIDILDEDIKQTQNIINTIKLGQRFEGKNYTNGRF